MKNEIPIVDLWRCWSRLTSAAKPIFLMFIVYIFFLIYHLISIYKSIFSAEKN